MTTVHIMLSDTSTTDYFFDWTVLEDGCSYDVYITYKSSNKSHGIGHRSGQFLSTTVFNSVYGDEYDILNTNTLNTKHYGSYHLLTHSWRPDDVGNLNMSRVIDIDRHPIRIKSRPVQNYFKFYYLTAFNAQNPYDVKTNWNDDIFGTVSFRFEKVL